MRSHKQSGKTRYIALAALLLAIATAVLLASCAQNSAQGYLRLHIRADSDSEIDQNVNDCPGFVFRQDGTNELSARLFRALNKISSC